MPRPTLTVGRRLTLTFAVLGVMLAAIAVLAVWGLQRVTHDLDRLFAERLMPVYQVGDVQYLTTRNRLLLTDATINFTPEVLQKRAAEFKKNVDKMNESWDAYARLPLDEAERALMTQVDAKRTEFREKGLGPVMKALKAGNQPEALAALNGEASRLNPALSQAMTQLMEFNVTRARDEIAKASSFAATIKLVLAGVAALSLAGAGMLVWLTARRITGQLGAEPAELNEAVERVAAGDLAARIAVRAGDQNSTMAAVARMRDRLADVVSTVRRNADCVATGSAEIAQGNIDLSSRTELQASELQQTASTMDQLSSTVRNNAENARAANQLAADASQVAERGGAIVGRVVDTMKGINDSSRRISDIISTIDGIAFQTNILALNAAVEAARAGEQGRGFAVVAGEVRLLAQRSAGAAKEIKDLITHSVEQVDAGTTLVDDAGRTMGEIVTSIQRVSGIVAEISTASHEQSEGVDQVGKIVTRMDQGTQQNAALVEQSAAAAASLKTQAQSLLQAVDTFRLSAQAA